MTTRELFLGFSEALLQDERILSKRERELLAKLAQNAREHSTGDVGTMSEIIARTVGETVLQRASAALGTAIVQQMLSQAIEEVNPSVPITFSGPRPPQPGPGQGVIQAGPRPPQPGPGPGVVQAGPRPPQPGPGPGILPAGPRPPQPGPGPRAIYNTAQSEALEQASVAVLTEPEFLGSQFIVLDEFLMPQELAELTSYALQREADFVVSEVVAPGAGDSAIDYEHRRSRVLMDLGDHGDILVNRINQCMPLVLQKLGRSTFPVTRVEAQMTASNDGDYFRHHSDNGQGEIATRELTFVYFFHREPKAFEGGELRIYDTQMVNGEYLSTGRYKTIVPGQNQIVLFPSSLLHEITPVQCPSRAFADSRFTLNGWFHR
ncbi:MAG TPA: 2OG-Fe(II) oxygenase [Terriglobales bacterium]|nr:2OG-Fe(II) oxygenase [Terriglobales bacterium]